MLTKLRGMYAFGSGTGKRSLFLAHDPFGIKPLDLFG